MISCFWCMHISVCVSALWVHASSRLWSLQWSVEREREEEEKRKKTSYEFRIINLKTPAGVFLSWLNVYWYKTCVTVDRGRRLSYFTEWKWYNKSSLLGKKHSMGIFVSIRFDLEMLWIVFFYLKTLGLSWVQSWSTMVMSLAQFYCHILKFLNQSTERGGTK